MAWSFLTSLYRKYRQHVAWRDWKDQQPFEIHITRGEVRYSEGDLRCSFPCETGENQHDHGLELVVYMDAVSSDVTPLELQQDTLELIFSRICTDWKLQGGSKAYKG